MSSECVFSAGDRHASKKTLTFKLSWFLGQILILNSKMSRKEELDSLNRMCINAQLTQAKKFESKGNARSFRSISTSTPRLRCNLIVPRRLGQSVSFRLAAPKKLSLPDIVMSLSVLCVEFKQ